MNQTKPDRQDPPEHETVPMDYDEHDAAADADFERRVDQAWQGFGVVIVVLTAVAITMVLTRLVRGVMGW